MGSEESIKKTADMHGHPDNKPPAWMSRFQFSQHCKNEPNLLHPLLRLFLLSDGTVLHFLEGLFLEAVAFELTEQQDMILTHDDAARLSVEQGEKGIKRSGWFCVDRQGDEKNPRRRVVHTVSLLPIASLAPDVYRELLLQKKPLGQILYDRPLTFRRDHVEIGQSLLPEVAQRFGLSSETPLWIRRCHLTLSGTREGAGLLMEVFSPNIPLWAHGVERGNL